VAERARLTSRAFDISLRSTGLGAPLATGAGEKELGSSVALPLLLAGVALYGAGFDTEADDSGSVTVRRSS
jgi:hypothetical protein